MKQIYLLLATLLLVHVQVFGQSVPSYVPTNGLVGWWGFNGNANDESGNGNHGTVNGVTLTHDRNGVSGSAYNFDPGQWISVPHSSSIAVQQSITISIWFWMDGGGCNPRLFEINQNLNSCGGYMMAFNGTSNTSRTLHGAGFGSCSGGIGFGSQTPIPALSWQHMAMSIDGLTGVGKLYWNGQLIETVNGNPIPAFSYNNNALTIGNINPGRCDWWGGKIDDFGIWNRALSATEISELYTTQASFVPSCNLGRVLSVDTTVCEGTSVLLRSLPGQSTSPGGASCFATNVRTAGNLQFALNTVVKDGFGNFFLAGAYQGNVTIGGVALGGIGGRDIFVAKFDSCGSLIWVNRAGSSGDQDFAGGGGRSLAVDTLGNLFVVGRYNQAFTFFGTGGSSFSVPYTATSNSNHQDGFMVKLDPSGHVLWGASLRGGSNDGFNAVTVDASGSPVVAGGFNGCCPSSFNVTIHGPTGSQTVNSFGSNYGSGLLVKFSASGSILWTASVFNRDTDIRNVVADADNNIYLTSSFRSWSNGTPAQFIDASGANNTLFNPGIGLGYLVKLNASGLWQWGVTFGNTGDGVSSLTYGADVTVDAQGNPWVCGAYRGAPITFYSTNGNTQSGPASSTESGFLVQYSSGGVPISSSTYQHNGVQTLFQSLAMGVGQVGVVGMYNGNNRGSNDMLMVRYDLNGTVLDTITGGGAGDDQVNTIIPTNTGFVVSGTNDAGAYLAGNSLNDAGTWLWNMGTGSSGSSNANSVVWSTGATSAQITVSPTQTTTYTVTFSDGVQSCTDTVVVTVLNADTIILQDTIPQGQVYPFGGQSLTASGQYTALFTNVSGCDSLVELSLHVNPNVSLNCAGGLIAQSDTSICAGGALQLSLGNLLSSGAAITPVWELLISSTAYNPNEVNFNPTGYNSTTGKLYSVLQGSGIDRVYEFDFNNNTVHTLPATGGPGELYNFAYDFSNQRLLASRVGRDAVFSLPLSGGVWSQTSSGSFDSESYGSNSFWNPVSGRFGFFGGYGWFATKNWIWENNGGSWLNPYPNNGNCLPAMRVGSQLAPNHNGTKLYIFSGQGSCDGNQFASSCALGSPWPTDVGVYCWLKDIWELDLTTYQFTNVLPVNSSSVIRQGAFSYDHQNQAFYLIGGNAPTATYGVNTPFAMEVYRFRRNVDAGFLPISFGGNAPPAGNSAGTSIYDATRNRIIYARNDGIWALNLGAQYQVTWSTGDTTAAITVSPTQTTTYYATISNGIHSCVDSVTVNVIPNSLNPNIFAADSLFHCGDSLLLDAGSGYSRYEWSSERSSGDSTQTKLAHYTGWYKVRVFDGVCSVEDSVFVSLINVHLSSNDSLLCVGTGAELKVLFNNQKSLYFNGNSQFASNNGNYISRDNFTLEIVAKPNASSGSGFLIGPSHGGYYDGGVGIQFNKNSISVMEHGDGYLPAVLTYNFSAPINDFIHITLVYSNKSPHLYINGILVASGTSSPRQHIFISFNSATWPGQYGGLGGHTYGWFDGWVSKVTVRDLALNTNQIQNVYSQYLSGVFDSNLKEHYSFDGSPMLRANIDPSNSLFFSSNTPTWTDIIPNQPNLSFLWSTGDTTAAITVSPTQTTTYYVTVSNGIHSCVDSVTVNVIPNTLNPNIFAADSLFHCGDSLLLDAGSGYSRYEWSSERSSGDSTQTKLAHYTGWYKVRVFDGVCSVEDSVFLSIIPAKIADNDTTICNGSSVELNLNLTNYSTCYTQIGFYNGKYIYQTCSAYSWTSALSLINSIGLGTSFLKIDDQAKNNYIRDITGTDVYWIGLYQDQNSTQYFEPYGGWKWADGTYPTFINWGPCEPNNDNGIGDFGMINTACGSHIPGVWNDGMDIYSYKSLFESSVLINPISVFYQWSTGDTTAAITVSPTQTTTYYVTVSNGIHSCVDSVTVNVIPNTLNPNLFAVDSLFHCGDSLLLDAGSGYSSYEWSSEQSSGDSTQTKLVRYTGWYKVRVFDGVCSVEDSVFVSIIPEIITVRDTVICSTHSISIHTDLGPRVNFLNTETDLVIGTGQVYYADSVRSDLLSSVNSGELNIQLNSVQGFYPGKIVLIYQTQVAGSVNDSFAGQFCYRKIIQISGNSILLDRPLLTSFFAGADGKAQVIQVPSWRNVLVEGTITCHEWDGNTGGVLAMICSQLRIATGGVVTASGKGFRGGQTVLGWGGGHQGESCKGNVQQDYAANYSGGGGGNAEWCHSGQGGGGGGYLNVGQNGGSPCYGCGGGWWFGGGCGHSGYGGQAVVRSGANAVLGSGGGSGGIDGDNPDGGGFGGRGGGFVVIECSDIAGTGVVEARGMVGDHSPGETGGGGGGSGGFIGLNQNPSGIGLDVSGGQGGKKWDSRFGGDGSIGRLDTNLIDALGSIALSYTWSTGDTTASITVSPTQTTTYFVTVSNGIHSCVDSITVTVHTISQNFLGSDSVSVCGGVYTLDAGGGFDTYNWSNGTQNRTLMVTTSGWYHCMVGLGSCTATDSVFVDLFDVNLVNSDTTLNAGDSITLYTLAPPGNSQLISLGSLVHQQYLSFIGPSSFTIPNLPSGSYFIEVSGTYCIGSCWIGNTIDAAYSFHQTIQPYPGSFSINQYCPQGTSGCIYPRPINDTFNPYHIYYYSYFSNGGDLTIHGLADECCWGDNIGGLTFKVYQALRTHSILWSTGDTTASITVSPNQTTTYYVTMSNGITTCIDSIRIEVNQVWPGARMKGRAVYATNPNVPLGQVQVLLKQNGTVVGTTTTTNSGDFDLGTRGSGSYALEFVSTALWRGVNTTDALMAMRHFTGAMTLSGIRLQAGNVNNRGLVNGQEALRITQRTVDRNLPFLSGNWAFAPTQVQVQFGDTLVNVPVPALCYGDVNASYFPAPPARLAGDPLLAVGRLEEPNSDTWEWPVYLTESKSIGAMTIELLLPEGLSVEDVLVTAKSEPGSNPDPGYLAHKQEGQVLRISWFGLDALLPRDGEELFRLKVRGNANGPLRLIPTSELADGMAQPYNSFRLAAPVPGSGAWQVALYPNPSSDKASIALTLPSSGTVTYSVVDALGRLVVEGREIIAASGFKGIDLESTSWSAGTYSVRIQWQGARTTEDRLLRFVKLNP